MAAAPKLVGHPHWQTDENPIRVSAGNAWVLDGVDDLGQIRVDDKGTTCPQGCAKQRYVPIDVLRRLTGLTRMVRALKGSIASWIWELICFGKNGASQSYGAW
jgi:hypothetical protein